MPLDTQKDFAIIAGSIIALVTFFSGVVEYARQTHLRRAQQFVEMRRRFLETGLFQEIIRLLAHDDPALRNIPIQDRRNFGGFLEEVALMVNSRLIPRPVAHYMFGHYVLLTERSVHFWDGLDRDGTYWQLFHRFAADMRTLADQPTDFKRLRF
ncbi:MAG: hypothetical protein ACO1SV_20035 [Fimbriimonas sp.]